MYFSLINLTDRSTYEEPPLDTYKFAIQGNKCTLTICWILLPDFMDTVSRKNIKTYRNIRILYWICINTMPLSVYIDRPHCYNKEVVSIWTHLNFYYVHDSFIPFFYFYWLQAIYLVDTCPLVCLYVILLVIKPSGIRNATQFCK
jgi:hypothetical protein